MLSSGINIFNVLAEDRVEKQKTKKTFRCVWTFQVNHLLYFRFTENKETVYLREDKVVNDRMEGISEPKPMYF